MSGFFSRVSCLAAHPMRPLLHQQERCIFPFRQREQAGNAREQAANRCRCPALKKATLTAIEMHPQACLQDDFAWRVNLPAHLILFPPFLIPGEKGVPRRGMSGKVEY